jgi:Protein of unknown function (DUF2490)
MRDVGVCRVLLPVCLAILVWLGAAAVAVAGESSTEFWPEVDLWFRLTPSWRVSTLAALTRNLETDYREGSLVLQADYAWGKPGLLYKGRLLDESGAQSMKAMMARAGYLGATSLGDGGDAYREKTIFLEWHLRVPLKSQVLLSHRLRTDLRWLGDPPEFSERWRYRIMVEKEINAGRCSWVPYGSVEAFYDSRYDTINRLRSIAGTSVAWTPRIALEGNFTYQYDSEASVTNVYALNLILHVYFERQPRRTTGDRR